MTDNAPAPMGHNSPPWDETLKAQLDDIELEAANWLDGADLESQEQADCVGVIIGSLRKVKTQATKDHKEEKAPLLKQTKALDARKKHIVDRADRIISVAQAPVTRFLEEQERKLREEQRRKEEEARKAQEAAAKAAREAEQAGNLEAADEAANQQDIADELAKDAKAAAKAKPQVQGAGKAIGLRRRTRVIITDRKALLQRVMKHDPDALTDFLQGYAQSKLPQKLAGTHQPQEGEV